MLSQIFSFSKTPKLTSRIFVPTGNLFSANVPDTKLFMSMDDIERHRRELARSIHFTERHDLFNKQKFGGFNYGGRTRWTC